MQIQKVDDSRYRIHDDSRSVEIDHDKFEDLYHSADGNPTAWYRVLVDSVCETADQRTAMTAMISAGGDMEATLKGLQEQVKSLGL